MQKRYDIIMLFAFSLLLSACNSKKADRSVNDLQEPYPISIIRDTLHTGLLDQTKLYPVTEDFLASFLKNAENYKGHPVTANVTFPATWGVRCVERLPEGKELWLMQSESREWMYLVITSGYGTQRILDLIPVAINVAIQKKNQLETEKWSTVRDADGSFVVTKEYEWIQSLTDISKQKYESDPEKYHRKTSFVDRYYINDMGRFDYSEAVDTMPDYNAVVFFYDAAHKPSMWDDCVPRLQAFCEENNIYFEEVYQHFDQVIIHDFMLKDVVGLNIAPYVENTECGMLLLKKGEEPKVVGFGNYDYMQIALKRYFKLRQNNT